MSPACSLKPVYSFSSAASFEAFDIDLTHKLAVKQLTAVSIPDLTQVGAAFLQRLLGSMGFIGARQCMAGLLPTTNGSTPPRSNAKKSHYQ
jgi:hypothetical protein